MLLIFIGQMAWAILESLKTYLVLGNGIPYFYESPCFFHYETHINSEKRVKNKNDYKNYQK